MQWTDTAIVLTARKHGENSAVARVLSREHGVYAGVVRAIHSKTMRGIVQPGNVVSATWNARLSEQLGTFKMELLEAGAAGVMHDGGKLSALSSACFIIESALPERHPYPGLYKDFLEFLRILKESDDWQADYVRFELNLLADTGFGLDLTGCAATGTTENLIYVSPKSGRAACAQAGEPYKDKLLTLPGFLLASRGNVINPAEILAGMELTGYFLEHWLLAPHNRKLPAARKRLIETIKKEHAAESEKA